MMKMEDDFERGEATDEKCQVEIAPGRLCGHKMTLKNLKPSERSKSLKQHARKCHQDVKCRDKSCDQLFAHRDLMLEHYEEKHQREWRCINRNKGCHVRFRDKDAKQLHQSICEFANKPVTSEQRKLEDAIPCPVELAPGKLCGVMVLPYRNNRHCYDWHRQVTCKEKSCGRSFDHKQLLHDHSVEEHQRFLWCRNHVKGCYACFNDKDLWLDHMRQCDVTDEVEEVPQCGILLAEGRVCGMRVTQTHGNRWRHNRTWHQEIQCDIVSCDLVFPHKRLMLDHYGEEHQVFWHCKNRSKGYKSTFFKMERALAHENWCDPSSKRFMCGWEGCTAGFQTSTTLQCHLYLRHSLNTLQLQEYLGTQEDEDDSESDDDWDEEDDKAKRQKLQTFPIPVDSETGVAFKVFKFGHPAWKFDLLDYDLFQIFYHYGLRVPVFTFQLLFPELLSSDGSSNVAQRPTHFRIDRSMAKIYRRGSIHYAGLRGVHRGHLVPFTDYKLLPVVARNTCLFSNVLPMLANFNLSVWKRVENDTTDFARLHTVTIVVTVALFQDPVRTEGPKHLPFPNRYAKIMLGLNTNKKWDLRVYNVPHSDDDSITPDTPLSTFLGDLRDIEEQLGHELFPALLPEQLEKNQVKKKPQTSSSSSQYRHQARIIEL